MSQTSESLTVPRSLRYTSLIALAVGVVAIFVGGWRIGVTWDEPLHVQRFNNYLQTGWYLGDGQFEHGQPAPKMTQQYVYGPATMLILHALDTVTGVEKPGLAQSTASAYAIRHVGIGLISLLGIAALAGTARLLFRRWDWALVSATLLATLPIWTGHSMFNLKDIPVATGYSLTTLGLCLIARGEEGKTWRRRLPGPMALACGAFLAVGTRPGMWVGIGASVLIMFGCLLVRPDAGPFRRRLHEDLWRYRDIVLGLAVAAIALWAIYPRLFGSPIHALWNAAFASANFSGLPSSHLFILVRVPFEMPLFLLAFVGLGIYVAARQLARHPLRPDLSDSRLLLVLMQMLFLPAVTIVHGASLYGDLRQVLFAAPATVLVATLGMRHLVDVARESRDRNGPPVVALLVCATVAIPLVDQMTLFPYNYAYYNPMASAIHLPIDGEYYRGSARELVSDLPNTGRIVCSAETDKQGNALRLAHLDGWVDCRTSQVSPIAPFLHGQGPVTPPLAADQFWAISFNPRGPVAPNCVRITGITRGVGFQRMHMATLSRCTRKFPVLSAGTVRFTAGSAQGVALPDAGWFVPGTDQSTLGIRSRGGPSTMIFQLDRRFASRDVVLILETSTSTIPSVSFGGSPVDVAASSTVAGRLQVHLPRVLVNRAVDGPQTLQFRSSDSDPLDLKILTMQVDVLNPPAR